MTVGAVQRKPSRGGRQLARLRRHWPWLAVVAVVAIGLLAMYAGYWRKGLFTIGVASLLGALFRAVLPARRVALLVVRSRAFDVATLVTLGLVIVISSAIIPTISR